VDGIGGKETGREKARGGREQEGREREGIWTITIGETD